MSRISKITRQVKDRTWPEDFRWRISTATIQMLQPNMVIPQAARILLCLWAFCRILLERCPFFANMMVLSLIMGLLGVAKIDVNSGPNKKTETAREVLLSFRHPYESIFCAK